MGKKVKKLKNKATPLISGKSNGENEPSSATQRNPAASPDAGSTSARIPANSCKATSKYTAAQLLSKVEDCMDRFEYDVALKFCERAVELEPNNTAAIEMLGFLRMQTDDLETARKHFNQAIALEPERGHSKYMYMGQISTGMDAVHFYQKGIEIMKRELVVTNTPQAEAAATAEDKPTVTCRDVSSAYCAIAELYMTDVCFEEDAEVRCREHIDQALEADPSNVEAYQTLASFLLCKQEKRLALESIEKGLALWLPQLRQSVQAESNEPVDPVVICPVSFPVRISYAKTLIELESYEVAEEILGFLMQEDNEIVEVWYLLGWVNYLRGEEFYANAQYHLTKGHQLALKIRCEEEQMVNHMKELLDEVGRASDSDLEDGGVESDDEEEKEEENSEEETMDQ